MLNQNRYNAKHFNESTAKYYLNYLNCIFFFGLVLWSDTFKFFGLNEKNICNS